MVRRPVLVATVLLTLACACGPRESPGPGPAAPDAEKIITSKLRAQQLQIYADPFKDRKLAPSLTSLEQDPGLALGVIYVREAQPGKTCDSSEPADFQFTRLTDLRADTCETRPQPARTLSSQKVQGGGSTHLDYLVGTTGLDAKYAFEISISEPSTAVMSQVSRCIDEPAVARLTLPPRTCAVHYIVGAVLLQATYRKYFEANVDTANAFSVVNFGGKALYSDSDLQHAFFLTIDDVPLGQHFERDAEGFLRKPARPSSKPPTPEARWLELARTPDEVERKILRKQNADKRRTPR